MGVVGDEGRVNGVERGWGEEGEEGRGVNTGGGMVEEGQGLGCILCESTDLRRSLYKWRRREW